MVLKNKKLHEQFDVEASSSHQSGYSSRKSLSHGVSIFLDGYTALSSQELRGYILVWRTIQELFFQGIVRLI